MTYKYKIINFDPQQGLITIEFEGHEAYAFNAPFINGNYLTGQALEDYIQTLYPQVLPYESRLALVQTISGTETLTQLVQPPIPYIETATPIVPEQPALVVSVEPVKSTCYIGEPQEVIVTFDKPITINTFINIMLSIPSTSTLYMPNQYDSIGPSPIKPFKITGINGETLEMYVGDTTARYTSPIYPGGVSYTQATISVKTVLNQQDRQEYITSGPIQLISDPVPNA
jgi:hypothetical protein